MKPFISGLLISLIISLAVLQIQQEAFSQQPIDRNLIRRSQVHELQPIPHELMQFTVMNSNNQVGYVNTTISSFSLASDQTYASFSTNRVYLDEGILPEDAMVLPEAGISKSTENNDVLHQIYLSEIKPFTYNTESGLFHGSIKVFPVEGHLGPTDAPQTRINLAEPFEMTVNAVGIEEKQILVESLNWPAINVEFSFNAFENPLTDNVNILVQTVQNPEGYEKPLKINPYIHITIEKDHIQGLGIQEAPVSLSLEGVTDYQDITVNLETTKGYFNPDTITLKANQTSRAMLRSEGTGRAMVSASGTNLVSSRDYIRFMFPWKFLLFSIIGAAIGALIHVLRKQKRGFNTRAFIISILLGVTVSLCYWALGINLLQINVDINYFNEFAVIALSILGALFGWQIGVKKDNA